MWLHSKSGSQMGVAVAVKQPSSNQMESRAEGGHLQLRRARNADSPTPLGLTPQDLNADSVKVHYACCVYLVLKAEADAGKPAVESASIGTLLKGLEINVFLFFRIVTQMFQSAGRDAWFRDIFGGDCAQSEKDFRQLEAHFIILVILFAKYRKVTWTHPTAPSSPPHKCTRTRTDGRTYIYIYIYTHTH
jgi:hypothetical protein